MERRGRTYLGGDGEAGEHLHAVLDLLEDGQGLVEPNINME